MAKSMRIPHHHTQIWFFPKLFLQSWKHAVVYNGYNFPSIQFPFTEMKGIKPVPAWQCPVFKASSMKTWFAKVGLNLIGLLRSLNSSEHLWDEVKSDCTPGFLTCDEEWSQIPAATLQNLMESLPRRAGVLSKGKGTWFETGCSKKQIRLKWSGVHKRFNSTSDSLLFTGLLCNWFYLCIHVRH